MVLVLRAFHRGSFYAFTRWTLRCLFAALPALGSFRFGCVAAWCDSVQIALPDVHCYCCRLDASTAFLAFHGSSAGGLGDLYSGSRHHFARTLSGSDGSPRCCVLPVAPFARLPPLPVNGDDAGCRSACFALLPALRCRAVYVWFYPVWFSFAVSRRTAPRRAGAHVSCGASCSCARGFAAQRFYRFDAVWRFLAACSDTANVLPGATADAITCWFPYHCSRFPRHLLPHVAGAARGTPGLRAVRFWFLLYVAVHLLCISAARGRSCVAVCCGLHLFSTEDGSFCRVVRIFSVPFCHLYRCRGYLPSLPLRLRRFTPSVTGRGRISCGLVLRGYLRAPVTAGSAPRWRYGTSVVPPVTATTFLALRFVPLDSSPRTLYTARGRAVPILRLPSSATNTVSDATVYGYHPSDCGYTPRLRGCSWFIYVDLRLTYSVYFPLLV